MCQGCLVDTERRFNPTENTRAYGLCVGGFALGDARRSLASCLSRGASHSGLGCLRSSRFQAPINHILHYEA